MNTVVLQGTLMATSHGIHRINRHNRNSQLTSATTRLGRYLKMNKRTPTRPQHDDENVVVSCEEASEKLLPNGETAKDDEQQIAEVLSEGVHSVRFMRVNVGGSRFLLRTSTINARHCGRLYWMLRMSHEQRLTMVDAYFEDFREYYFERPPLLFHIVYQFYLTGLIHQPLHVCPQDLLDELNYWGIAPGEYLAQCCCIDQQTSNTEQNEDEEESDKPNYFKHLRCGEYRRKVWNLIEKPTSSTAAQIFAAFSVLFLLISISGLVLGSLPELQVPISKQNASGKSTMIEMEPHPFLGHLEYVCIVWFTFEYASKMLVTYDRRKTFLKLLNLIDLMAILPFLIEIALMFVGINTDDLRDLKGAFLVIRILRVLRVIRVLKLGRYSSGLQMFGKTLKASFRQLGMMAMVVLTGVIFFSTLVYFLEKDEPGSEFYSIPAACWWCIVTMTTVGYGDLTPATVLGKLVATGAIACGVLVLALPITIIVDNFMKVAEGERNSGVYDQQQQRFRRIGPRGRIPISDQASTTSPIKNRRTAPNDSFTDKGNSTTFIDSDHSSGKK